MKKILLLFLTTLTLFNCKSQQLNKSILDESKSLMTYIFNDFDKKALDKRNLTNIRFIKNEILHKPSTVDYKSWKDLVLKSDALIPLAVNYNIINENDKIDYSNIFTEEEINYMSKQIGDIRPMTWQDYIGIKPIKKSIKKYDNAYQDNINVASGTFFLTQPVFTINHDFALIYQENGFGGILVIYQKINNSWKAVASTSVWVS